MTCISKIFRSCLLLILLSVFCSCASSSHVSSSIPASSKENISLIEVTPHVIEYVNNTVKPAIVSYPKRDKLSLLLKVSEILNDPIIGIHTNKIEPSNYIIYDKLNKIKFGFFITLKLSPEQKEVLKSWHSKYMQKNPADVFFAPSAEEIIKTKAAFGCTHYARAFIAVVKALGMIDDPKGLRYVISSKADDYNQAFEKKDSKMTINGHQFVMVRIDSKWIAINTSKSEYMIMPEDFLPDNLNPPKNIPIRFKSYPDITFLIRKIGKDNNDDCNDNSLSALMNISRSGDSQCSDFRWEEYVLSE